MGVGGVRVGCVGSVGVKPKLSPSQAITFYIQRWQVDGKLMANEQDDGKLEFQTPKTLKT